MGEYYESTVQAYMKSDWKLANYYADLAKEQDRTLNRDEYRRRAREDAQRRVGPIRGPQGEEPGRWGPEYRGGPLHFR